MDQVENLVRSNFPALGFDAEGHLDYDAFHVPLQEIVHLFVDRQIDPDPNSPGKLRIDAGRLTDWGLEPNPDAVIDLEFLLFDGYITTSYNLADELLSYAEKGEGAWDVERQIDQLIRTIAKLKSGAAERGWSKDESS